jgi:predicted acyltransferase
MPDHDPSLLPAPDRLTSLDALRGLNMFWIIGIDELVPGLSKLEWAKGDSIVARSIRFATDQLTHKAWAGLAFEDTIFPLFVFIVGVSLVFSLTKALDRGTRGQAVGRVVYRAAVLYFLGLLVYGGFDQPIFAFHGQNHGHHAIRWLGVLQRIAIAYGATGLLFCTFRPRGLALWAIGLLVGYWLLMAYVPVPGVGRGSYAEGHNLANYLDQRFLGGYKWDGDHDPEGLLSTLPAIATCLLGVFAGLVLQARDRGPYRTAGLLIVAGVALAALGYAWGFLPSPVQFPVIKKIWTSSFVLLTAGYASIILGLFYLVVDVWGLRFWCTPFVWIGTNAITVYMLAELGLTHTVAARLVGGGRYDHTAFGSGQWMVTEATSMAIAIAVARFLYVRRVFIRV